MLNPHKAQGMAARIVSNLLSGILQTDMVETILQGSGPALVSNWRNTLDATLKEIRRLVKPFGSLVIKRNVIIVHMGDDSVSFNRMPEELAEAKAIIEQDYYSEEKEREI